MHLLGNPKSGFLTPSEHDLFEEAGISLPQGSRVFFYSKILLSDTNRVVTAESVTRSSKRNDSCVTFCDRGHSSKYGLVQKFVLSEQSDASHTCAIVKVLHSAPIQLCQDPVTQAKLQHIRAFECPRYN